MCQSLDLFKVYRKLSFVFLGKLDGIREGTVICALLVGKLMKPMQKVLKPAVEKICGIKGSR